MGKMYDDEAAAIAAFLRKRGAVRVAPAAAYGVDPEADRIAARERRARERHEARVAASVPTESDYERYREEVEDAYMGGGSRARDEVMGNGVRSWKREGGR